MWALHVLSHACPSRPLRLSTVPATLILPASVYPRCRQASRILAYLGDHLMLLTSMNLRDYLLLKVGAGGGFVACPCLLPP